MSYIVYIYIYSGMRAGHYWHWTSNRVVGPRFDKISVCCCAIAQLYNAICGNKESHPPPLLRTNCQMIKLIYLIRRERVNWFRGYFGWLSPENGLDWTGLGPRDRFNDERYRQNMQAPAIQSMIGDFRTEKQHANAPNWRKILCLVSGIGLVLNNCIKYKSYVI